MSVFNTAMDKLMKLEFNDGYNALHFNKGEQGYTFMGIYEFAHPDWEGWNLIYKDMMTTSNLRHASLKAYSNPILREMVYKFYEQKFWRKMKLHLIQNTHKATEIFIFGVNVSPRVAIKKTQKLVGVKVDGFIGRNTINAINKYDSKKFNIDFDNKVEKAYYRFLAFVSKNKKRYARFYPGWERRADYV